MDIWSKEKRSEVMSRIRGKNTKPEMALRSLLHSIGYRFRLHRNDLPGKPDIVLPKFKTAIFVHGCFWHRHEGCKDSGLPKTDRMKWEEKLNKNVDRDKRNIRNLQNLGWRVAVIWECEIEKEIDGIRKRLDNILSIKKERVHVDKENLSGKRRVTH